jgi:acyl-homoserine lactone acylase PvdQ
MLVPYIGTELDQRYAKNHHLVTPIVRALDGDGSLAPIGITATSVRAALPRAVHDAERQFNLDAGSGVKRIPAWGSVNAAVYHHPLGVRWPLSLLNAPEVAQPGDVFTIFQSRPDFGPSMRFVADLSDWDDSSLLLTLGESGLWTDPHYDDQEDEWVNVAWHATPFTEAAIARDVREVLKLEPSE